MVVLLMLYPVVFLFGTFVQAPLLVGHAGIPFAAALFIGNVVSIVLLNHPVPCTNRRLGWWMRPPGRVGASTDMRGIALFCGLYALMVVVFSRAF